MNLTDVDELKNYLRSIGFKPKDYLGQNFLINRGALDAIIDAAKLSKQDMVLEVGPGLGILTEELVKRAGKVIAVEKDPRLVEALSRNAELVSASQKIDPELNSGLRVISGDILKFNVSEYINGNYKVVANIPYYLTSKLFQYFLEDQKNPELLVLMVQKEVGERVVALPGELSVLGISIQIYADAEIVFQVPKENFWPEPKVDSVILKIKPKEKYPEITDKKIFFRIVKSAFAGKRKQLQNSLSNGLALPKEEVLKILGKANIDPTDRPQDLAIEDWIRLYKNF